MVGGLAALSSDCCCGGGNGCCRCTGLCSNVASIEDCESEEVNEYFHSGVPCDPAHEDDCFYPCCAWPVTNITVTIVVTGFIDDVTPPGVCPDVEFNCGGSWSYDSCGGGDDLFSSQALCIDGSINATGGPAGVEDARRYGRAARLRHRAAHRADVGGRSRVEPGDDLSGVAAAGAEGLGRGRMGRQRE